MKRSTFVAITGAIVGIISVVLVALGNPGNMGFCIACFIRDIAGAIGLQRAPVVQYIRPEIIGLVFGALIMAVAKKEYSPRGGSSPAIRFVLAMCVMVGALVFLGCPLRMMLRIGGGDLNAIVGLFGFIVGIAIGVFFLNKGFSLKRAYTGPNKIEGLMLPGLNIGLLILLIAAPAFIFFSVKGPGSMHAPIIASLVAGLIVGALAQRTRFCTVAGIRDTMMFRDLTMLTGFITVIVVVAILNMIMGNFHLGFQNQPIAMTDGLWNFMGMLVVGFGSVLLGGCPMRQLILSGEGNSDSVVTVMGFLVGAAICHNFGIASSPEGPGKYGPAATIICLVVLFIIALTNLNKSTE